MGGDGDVRPRRLGPSPGVGAAAPASLASAARWEGFDLHAGVRVPAGHRDWLERVCRYGLRPAPRSRASACSALATWSSSYAGRGPTARRTWRLSDDIHLCIEKLCEWEDYYNYHRPHGGLDGQTPYERLMAKTRASVLPAS